jgi:anthranilate 1,2-dioxygenase small subunit
MDLGEITRRLELQDLYTGYAACLDTDALERWPEFFTDDCTYRITSAENYEAGLPLGLIYATSKNMLKDRVSALRQANIYEPQRYRHLISGVQIEKTEGNAGVSPAPLPNPPLPGLDPGITGEGRVGAGGRDGSGPDALDASASFMVVRTMQDGAMTLFAAGRYIDRVVRTDRRWKFAGKLVVLDSRRIDTLLAIPL